MLFNVSIDVKTDINLYFYKKIIFLMEYLDLNVNLKLILSLMLNTNNEKIIEFGLSEFYSKNRTEYYSLIFNNLDNLSINLNDCNLIISIFEDQGFIDFYSLNKIKEKEKYMKILIKKKNECKIVYNINNF